MSDKARECVTEIFNYVDSHQDSHKGAAEAFNDVMEIVKEHFPPAVPVAYLYHIRRKRPGTIESVELAAIDYHPEDNEEILSKQPLTLITEQEQT
jgi:hypothetical protein